MSWEWFKDLKLTDPTTLWGALAIGLVVMFLTAFVSRLLTWLLRRTRWSVGKLGRRVDPTVIRYMIHFKTLTLYLVAFIAYASQVPVLRSLVGTLAAGAGIAALVLGFAAKSTLSNIVAGLSIAFYRPIRLGDWISVDGEFGQVEDLTLRHTIVKTWEQKRIIVPNEKLDNMSVINYSIVDPTMLARVEVGVSYDTDLDYAKEVLTEVASECPHRDEKAEAPLVRVIDHSNSSIVLRVYMIVASVSDLWLARFWLFEEIKKRFDQRGIEIPFPYRTLVYKSDLPGPVRGEAGPEASTEATA